MRKYPLINPGDVFGRLTVIREVARLLVGKSKKPARMWECRCMCGSIKVIQGRHLKNHAIVSCGCLIAERAVKLKLSHGLSKLPEYHIWKTMIQRCTNKNNKDYKHYGGRGIRVNSRWMKFENFIKDLKKRPGDDYWIERIDNNKGYEPGNVRWATPTENNQNTRRSKFLTFGGSTLTVSEWSRRTGVKASTIYVRLSKGWSAQDALSKK